MIHPDTVNELTNAAHRMADKAGEVIEHYYRNLSIIEQKDDDSPVTIADKEVETAIREIIRGDYPDHIIQGEEFGTEQGKESDFRWVIDPIDGTAAFMIGRPTFGVLIALLYKDEPIIGVIDQPINKERWVGVTGQPTTLNGNEIKVSECQSLDAARLTTTGLQYFEPDEVTIFERISEQARFTVYGGDCYNYGLLAAGHVDVIVESGLKPHDFFPLVPIIEGAGGTITNWKGDALSMVPESGVIVTATKALHDEVLSFVQ